MKMIIKEECLILSRKDRNRENNQTIARCSLLVVNELVRKFSEMKLTKTKSSCRQLFSKIFDGFHSPSSPQSPRKKRKLSDRERDDSEIDCMSVASTRIASSETKDGGGTGSANILLLELPLCAEDLRKLLIQNIRKRIKPTAVDKPSRHEVTFQDVLDLFDNCALVLQRDSTQDIDSIVSRFSDFGKVLNIQNHWVKAKGCSKGLSTVWAGASVFYHTQEDLNRACKAMSLFKQPIIAVPLVDHLTRIHSMELLYRSKFNKSDTQGTTVVVEGFKYQTSKLRKVCGKYGKVLQSKWLSNRAPNYTCEVVYNSTWSAVAAALALDGNCQLYRCSLKARIKMTNKELYIHRHLCEMF